MVARADAVSALRRMSAEYISSRRASGELRTRLVGAVHERSRLIENVQISSDPGRLQRQLAEVEHVRGTLERSAYAAGERVRALEAVIAASVRAAGQLPPEPPMGPPTAPVPLPVRSQDSPRDVRPDVTPESPVRGGWSPPA